MPAVTFDAVDIVFGDRPQTGAAAARPGPDAASEILAETGQVLGVAGCTLAVERGEICVLMGLSGSGKSTLLRAVNRLNKVVRGSVTVEDDGASGRRRAPATPRTLRHLRMRRVAMVFQQFALLPWRTVAENVAFGLELRGVPQGRARADRRGEAGAGPSREVGRQVRARAVRRHAAARRARPRLRHRRRHPADGRAVLGPGPADPRQAAGRSAGAAAAAAQDDHLRQPRSRRGAEDRQHDRDHGGRPDHPGRARRNRS